MPGEVGRTASNIQHSVFFDNLTLLSSFSSEIRKSFSLQLCLAAAYQK